MMRIGEAAVASSMSAKTLRFYEDRGLLPPAKRAANGYREYSEETMGRLGFIRRGRAAGLTLAQIGDILAVRDHGDAPCAHVRDVLASHLADLDAQIAELRALRSAVGDFHAAVGDSVDCDPQRICSFL